MALFDRTLLLISVIKHETPVIGDLTNEENMETMYDKEQLKILLNELRKSDYIVQLNGVNPSAYTINGKRIAEDKRKEKNTLNSKSGSMPGGGDIDTISAVLNDLKQKNRIMNF